MTSEADLVSFVYHEARLLDERRFSEWLELFTEDAHYWMPAEWDQSDPRLQASLMYEDKLLLTIRVERLTGERTFSQAPSSRSHHLLQAPQVDEIGEVSRTYTPFGYTEIRMDVQTRFSGWARHEIVAVDGALKIRLKRVDILDFDSPHGNIQLFM